MDIKEMEAALGAQHVSSYASGHMGSQILRFQRNADKSALVVKFAPLNDADAIADFEANIRGYTEIRALGGANLVPTELREIPAANGRALVMRDLGASMRIADGGFDACVLLWKHFSQTIVQTAAQQVSPHDAYLPPFITEVIRHIERFSCGGAPDLLRAIRGSNWIGEWGKPAIMLFDFTPDNLFVNAERLSFIDPWNQETYLGHPAVSIGQFVTLMQLYQMRNADEAARMLKERCVVEMPAMLDCDASSTERAFRMGSTLQFVLSSYVRRESDPPRAAELAREAYNLWQ